MSYIFKTEPWDHQLKALDFLMVRDLGALYTDMGSGKTKVFIDLIVNKGFKRTLVIGTKKSCDVWELQIKLHSDIQDKNIVNLSKMSTKNKIACLKAIPKKENQDGYYIFICNYDSVWIKPLNLFLLRKTFGLDCVICDESHRIKTPSSRCSRYLSRLGNKVKHKYLSTGTPLAENPLDVYAQYRFLDPTIFGTSYTNFKARYQNLDIARSAFVGYPVLDKKTPYINLDELREKMFSCAFKVKSSIELPETVDIDYTFYMSNKGQKVYKEVESEGVFESKIGSVCIENVLTLILRLQQITGGFLQVENEDKEKKFVRIDNERKNALQELLEGISKQEPVVIFAKFTKDLQAIAKVCNSLNISYSELSGKTDTLKEWELGKSQVLGVQYKAGSESVDLTRARYCIYYSLTHSRVLYEQSRKRIHRPGQMNVCTYYHLIALSKFNTTIDQDIMKCLKEKKEVIDYVLDTSKIKFKR